MSRVGQRWTRGFKSRAWGAHARSILVLHISFPSPARYIGNAYGRRRAFRTSAAPPREAPNGLEKWSCATWSAGPRPWRASRMSPGTGQRSPDPSNIGGPILRTLEKLKFRPFPPFAHLCKYRFWRHHSSTTTTIRIANKTSIVTYVQRSTTSPVATLPYGPLVDRDRVDKMATPQL